MRALILLVIGLVFGATAGFLAAGGLGPSSHDHDSHYDEGHDHATTTLWQGEAPRLDLILLPDIGTAQNLNIRTTNFIFAPEQVNGPITPNTGHAHIYINGKKVMRAYSAWVHLPEVPSGATIRVTLNANDHTHWAIDDQPLATEVTAP